MAEHYNAIIIGGGLSGIITALEIAEAGLSCLILDRDVEEKFGGLAKESFGGMFFVDSPEQRKAKIKDSAELALGDWTRFANFDDADHWPKAWAKTYIERCIPDIYEVVKKRGIEFFPVVNWVERGMYVPGNSYPRFHLVWGTGQELANVHITHLKKHITSGRVKVLYEHRVEELLRTAGRISGVQGVIEEGGSRFLMMPMSWLSQAGA